MLQQLAPDGLTETTERTINRTAPRGGTETNIGGTAATHCEPESANTCKAERPGDPEIADAILMPILELLAENGFRGTSLDAVALRA